MLVGRAGAANPSAGSGPGTVDLRDASANEEAESSATATIRAYNEGFRDSEVWTTTDGSFTQEYTLLVDPTSDTDEYEMKWDALLGDPPDSSTVAEGVWHPLSSGDFELEWDAPGAGDESSGSVTVSIRFASGSVLDTATWDGEAIATVP